MINNREAGSAAPETAHEKNPEELLAEIKRLQEQLEVERKRRISDKLGRRQKHLADAKALHLKAEELRRVVEQAEKLTVGKPGKDVAPESLDICEELRVRLKEAKGVLAKLNQEVADIEGDEEAMSALREEAGREDESRQATVRAKRREEEQKEKEKREEAEALKKVGELAEEILLVDRQLVELNKRINQRSREGANTKISQTRDDYMKLFEEIFASLGNEDKQVLREVRLQSEVHWFDGILQRLKEARKAAGVFQFALKRALDQLISNYPADMERLRGDAKHEEQLDKEERRQSREMWGHLADLVYELGQMRSVNIAIARDAAVSAFEGIGEALGREAVNSFWRGGITRMEERREQERGKAARGRAE